MFCFVCYIVFIVVAKGADYVGAWTLSPHLGSAEGDYAREHFLVVQVTEAQGLTDIYVGASPLRELHTISICRFVWIAFSFVIFSKISYIVYNIKCIHGRQFSNLRIRARSGHPLRTSKSAPMVVAAV